MKKKLLLGKKRRKWKIKRGRKRKEAIEGEKSEKNEVENFLSKHFHKIGWEVRIQEGSNEWHSFSHLDLCNMRCQDESQNVKMKVVRWEKKRRKKFKVKLNFK